jgi:hypothetical protein
MRSAIYLDAKGRNTTDKKQAEKYDYPFDFTDLVAAEGSAVASYTVTVSGVTKVADSLVGSVVFVSIDGGTVGQDGSVSLFATLADKDKFQLDLIVKVV